MKTFGYLVTVILGLFLIAGCSSEKKQIDSVQKVAVEIDKATLGDITMAKTYSGTLEGAEQSKIYATIPERVVSIPKTEGQYVKKGEPIIKLDKNGAASQYNQANAVYQNAKDNYEKMKRLYDQKAISEISYKSAETAYEVARANFNAAKAAVELSSPIDGIVTEIAVNLGQQVPLGVAIATVAKTKKMRLTIYVGLKEIKNITAGKPAKVFINSGEPIPAIIIESSRSADPKTRLFRVELEMDNPDNILKPGMYARASVVVDKFENVLTVSNRALFYEEGIAKVYIIRNDTAYVRTIEVGAADDERTQVISGLAQGQPVVVVGKSSLRDATPVIIPEKDSKNVSG